MCLPVCLSVTALTMRGLGYMDALLSQEVRSESRAGGSSECNWMDHAFS